MLYFNHDKEQGKAPRKVQTTKRRVGKQKISKEIIMKSIKQLRKEIALEEERSNKIIHEWFMNNFSKDDPISESFASKIWTLN